MLFLGGSGQREGRHRRGRQAQGPGQTKAPDGTGESTGDQTLHAGTTWSLVLKLAPVGEREREKRERERERERERKKEEKRERREERKKRREREERRERKRKRRKRDATPHPTTRGCGPFLSPFFLVFSVVYRVYPPLALL